MYVVINFQKQVFIFYYSLTGRTGVWRPVRARFHKKYVKPKWDSGRVSQNCWAFMSYEGPGAMCMLTRKLNAQLYVRLLNEHLLPQIQRLYPDNRRVYIIEDNCPVHTANIVREWYDRHPRLVRLDHPPR